MNGITKETWLKATPELRDEMLFELLTFLHSEIKAIKKWKLVHTAASAIGGFIGGVTAVWAWVQYFS